MACIVLILALAFPRIALLLIFLLSGYLERAYHTLMWPLLGFIFLPLTTIAYAWAINSHGSVDGFYLAAVVVAVLVDLGVLGSSRKARR